MAGGDAPRKGRGLTAEEEDAEDDADADSAREPDTKIGDLDCDDFDYQEDAQTATSTTLATPTGWMARSEKVTRENRVRRARICRAVSLPNLQHQPLKARAPGLDLSLSRRLALPPCRLALLRRRLLSPPLLCLQRGM